MSEIIWTGSKDSSWENPENWKLKESIPDQTSLSPEEEKAYEESYKDFCRQVEEATKAGDQAKLDQLFEDNK